MQTKPLVIVGSGNGGRIALDIARACGLPVRGFLSDDLPAGKLVNGAAVLGGDDLITDGAFVAENSFVISIGPKAARRRLALQLIARDADMPALIHPSCIVSPHSIVGAGSILVPGSIVNSNVTIGRFCIVNAAATIEHDLFLCDGVLISPGVHFGGRTYCGEDAFVGIAACTVAGVSIGRDAVVGAGAVVLRDVAAEDVVAGNPARSIKKKRNFARINFDTR